MTHHDDSPTTLDDQLRAALPDVAERLDTASVHDDWVDVDLGALGTPAGPVSSPDDDTALTDEQRRARALAARPAGDPDAPAILGLTGAAAAPAPPLEDPAGG